MIVVIFAILIIHIKLSFDKLSYGLAFFIAIRVLVPETVRTPIPSLSLNAALILILLIITILKRRISLNDVIHDKYGIFLLFFSIYPFFALFFSDYLNLSMQQYGWLKTFASDYLPAFLSLFIIRTEDDLDDVVKGFLITMFITTIYGTLSFLSNRNIWHDFVTSSFPQVDVSGEFVEQNEYFASNRRTSSTFISCNCYGYYLTYILLFILLFKNKLSSKLYYSSLILIISNMVFSTKRSPIVTLIFVIIYMIIHKKRLIVPFAIIITICFIILFIVPELENAKRFLMTAVFFWDDEYAHSQDVYGSSFELRVAQVLYPFVEINNNLLFGHGYGWCSTYLSINQAIHPILYGFETIVSVVICELGIVGIILYGLLFHISYSQIKKCQIDTKINYSKLFILSIAVLYIATGAMYIFYFFIIVFLLKKSYDFDGYLMRKL